MHDHGMTDILRMSLVHYLGATRLLCNKNNTVSAQRYVRYKTIAIEPDHHIRLVCTGYFAFDLPFLAFDLPCRRASRWASRWASSSASERSRAVSIVDRSEAMMRACSAARASIDWIKACERRERWSRESAHKRARRAFGAESVGLRRLRR